MMENRFLIHLKHCYFIEAAENKHAHMKIAIKATIKSLGT